MKVYHRIEDFKRLTSACVTTGTFDGVHLGHLAIIQTVVKFAQQHQSESVLITFHPHPRLVLQPDTDLKLLTNIDERIDLLKATGLQHLLIIPFDKAFAQTSSLEFVRDLLVQKIGTKHLIIGYDHHFGRNREGSFEHLKTYGPLYGFEVKEISEQDIAQQKISSTQIRLALQAGDCSKANTLLGYPYFIKGEVIDGAKIGREIGFPTANIQLKDERKLIPKYGVYLCKVFTQYNQFYFGMLNIGVKPTFGLNKLTLEVHLFDFDGDLYTKQLKIELLNYIREELEFKNVNELIKQLNKDKLTCIDLIKQL